MKIGMLWYFGRNDKKFVYDIYEEIEKASIFYEKKYGYHPDRCTVNIEVEKLEESLIAKSGKKIILSRDMNIPPLHLWIGTEDDKNLKQVIFEE